MMKDKYIYRVLHEFFNNSYPASTEEKVQKWIIDSQWADEKNKGLQVIWDEVRAAPDEKNISGSLACVRQKIGLAENRQMGARNWRTWLSRVAVAIPVMLLLGGYFYTVRQLKTEEVLTSNNEQRACVLPDGSAVLLNSGSRLVYPSEFTDSVRAVTLEGEACFTVTGNSAKPFIVQTSALSVRVTGTRFDVSAYPADDRVITRLDSGGVQVNMKTAGNREGYVLWPGQQIIYNKIDKTVWVDTVTYEVAGWKNGSLVFEKATFNDILNTLHRRFNVAIVCDRQKFGNDLYTVKFVQQESLPAILTVLQDVIEDFHYKIENNRVILVKKGARK